ncbi:MAG: hypothetical protein NT007_11890 [Candidatus Kapabacteria bacterium]|nr:hypothetical protein [Candidatus Kapabacteria bacterium]
MHRNDRKNSAVIPADAGIPKMNKPDLIIMKKIAKQGKTNKIYK